MQYGYLKCFCTSNLVLLDAAVTCTHKDPKHTPARTYEDLITHPKSCPLFVAIHAIRLYTVDANISSNRLITRSFLCSQTLLFSHLQLCSTRTVNTLKCVKLLKLAFKCQLIPAGPLESSGRDQINMIAPLPLYKLNITLILRPFVYSRILVCLYERLLCYVTLYLNKRSSGVKTYFLSSFFPLLYFWLYVHVLVIGF